jgi:hypothetical protein
MFLPWDIYTDVRVLDHVVIILLKFFGSTDTDLKTLHFLGNFSTT